jgi:predicted aspartyl protease
MGKAHWIHAVENNCQA